MKFIKEQRDLLIGVKNDLTTPQKKSSKKKIIASILVSGGIIASSLTSDVKPNEPQNRPKQEIHGTRRKTEGVKTKANRHDHIMGRKRLVSINHPSNGDEQPISGNSNHIGTNLVSPVQPPSLDLTVSELKSKFLHQRIQNATVTFEDKFVRIRGYASYMMMSIPFNMACDFEKKGNKVGLKIRSLGIRGSPADEKQLNFAQSKMRTIDVKNEKLVMVKDNGLVVFNQMLQ